MENFKDKVVVITGGATGIGFGFAKAFGHEGAKIVISGRRENRLQEAVVSLTDLGIDTQYFVADVTKREEVEGDVRYDIRTNIAPILEQQLNHQLRQ